VPAAELGVDAAPGHGEALESILPVVGDATSEANANI
jgi:hypothetical protein